MKTEYTAREWNKILETRIDPKDTLKKEIPNLSTSELRKRINSRLKSFGVSDLAYKFKGRSKTRLVRLYTWLVELYDDPDHNWVFFEPIRKSNKKRFIVS